MSRGGGRVSQKAILIDIGGVLVPDRLSAAAAHWSARLGISPQVFLGALFGGNDDQVLIGRTSEESWWNIVANRLGVEPDLIAAVVQDSSGSVSGTRACAWACTCAWADRPASMPSCQRASTLPKRQKE